MSSGRGSIDVELHVPDFDSVRRFYGAFGFQVEREEPVGESGGYLVLDLDGARLAFWPGTKADATHEYFGPLGDDVPRGKGVEIIVRVRDLDGVYDRANELGCIVEEMRHRSWGLRDFRVADPFGYYLRFTEIV